MRKKDDDKDEKEEEMRLFSMLFNTQFVIKAEAQTDWD